MPVKRANGAGGVGSGVSPVRHDGRRVILRMATGVVNTRGWGADDWLAGENPIK